MDTWLNIKVEVNANYSSGDCSFSVFLNDESTPCADLEFLWCDAPLEMFRLLAFGNVNGGIFRVDNIEFYYPNGTSLFTETWEDDTVGSPPGAPWVYTEGGATATIVDID